MLNDHGDQIYGDRICADWIYAVQIYCDQIDADEIYSGQIDVDGISGDHEPVLLLSTHLHTFSVALAAPEPAIRSCHDYVRPRVFYH